MFVKEIDDEAPRQFAGRGHVNQLRSIKRRREAVMFRLTVTANRVIDQNRHQRALVLTRHGSNRRGPLASLRRR